MALYKYKALTPGGKLTYGCVSSLGVTEASSLLGTWNLETLWIRREYILSAFQRQLILFFLYLDYALRAGYPLNAALVMVTEAFQGHFRMILQGLQQYLSQGSLLSYGCTQYPHLFSGPLVALIKAGEESGQLSKTCQHIHRYLKNNEKQQRNMFKMLAYPMLTIVTFIITVCVLVGTLMPTAIILLKNQQNNWGWATHVLMALYQLSWYSSLGVVLLCIGFIMTPWGKKIGYALAGRWIFQTHYQQFFTTLSILLEEKIPLLQALDIASQRIKSPLIAAKLSQLCQDVRQGMPLWKTTAILPYFPPLYRNLIQAGDETGQQAHCLEILTTLMAEDIQRVQEKLSILVPPFIFLMIGVLLWIVIQGTFMPLYSGIGEINYGL